MSDLGFMTWKTLPLRAGIEGWGGSHAHFTHEKTEIWRGDMASLESLRTLAAKRLGCFTGLAPACLE